ncbi:MAG: tRNA (adenosine(37)-N6)-threonylcarbamoyltransferase complex ATPase subunit type 1 TsaE [Bacteroides sp.]|nr:tRNA (adenosine(37)-N6)-threonylcarbamoyltransferase complex ATPase subunit type 1 TsaE [Bacteroides sp.]
MKIEVADIEKLPEAAEHLLQALGDRHVVALEGAMGAGKTTLTAALCHALEMDDEASSPTFSIVNEYVSSATGRKVFHFDFYRIETPEEALDLGLDDYFDSGELCLMEWSGQVASLLPEDLAVVRIEEQPDGSRLITLDE